MGGQAETVGGSRVGDQAALTRSAGPPASGWQAGRLLVLDGERRRRAIRLAIDKEMLPADFPVPCLIGAGHGKAWAESASLATFVHREAIHPADEAAAYATLAGKGLGVREIGKRFGCTTGRIRQLLSLGGLSPQVLAAFRADQLTLDEAQAFTLGRDHAAQEAVLTAVAAEGFRASAWQIRRKLSEAKVAATSRLGLLVAATYRAGGLPITTDLFSRHGDEGWLDDHEQVQLIAQELLDAEAARLREAGWGWVEAQLDYDTGQLHATYRVADRDAGNDWSPALRATLGCIVTLGYQGKLEVRHGLERRGRQAAGKAARQARGALSETLAGELNVRRALAVQEAVARDFTAAFDLALYSMVTDLLLPMWAASPCRLQARAPEWLQLPKAARGVAEARLDAEAERLGALLGLERLDHEPLAIWQAVCGLDQPAKQALFAFLIARQCECPSRYGTRSPVLDAVGWRLAVDPAASWRPDKASYFGRMRKDALLAGLAPAIGPVAAERLARLKKAELCAVLEHMVRRPGGNPRQRARGGRRGTPRRHRLLAAGRHGVHRPGPGAAARQRLPWGRGGGGRGRRS